MKNTPFSFIARANVKIGENEALNLSGHLKEFGLKRIGIVVDNNVVSIPYVRRIITKIKRGGFARVDVWEYDIKGEPDYDSLERVKLLFLTKTKKPTVDCFIAIGGGSIIDTAKGLAILVVNPGNARKYRGFPTNLKPSLPVIALPTVAGSGSEATYNASFIDWKQKRKMGINTLRNFPRLSILDPLLTMSCPQAVTVCSAMDAMVHALESYATPKATPISRMFSLQAFSFVYHGLEDVVKDRTNKQARLELQLGAYLAGIAIVNAGGGPASILSYPLGVHAKVPHGLAGAVFLPFVIEHNVKNGFDYSEMYEHTKNADHTLSKKQKNNMFVKQLFGLADKLATLSMLTPYKIQEVSDIIECEIATFGDAFRTTNPVPFSPRDAKRIFRSILNSRF